MPTEDKCNISQPKVSYTRNQEHPVWHSLSVSHTSVPWRRPASQRPSSSPHSAAAARRWPGSPAQRALPEAPASQRNLRASFFPSFLRLWHRARIREIGQLGFKFRAFKASKEGAACSEEMLANIMGGWFFEVVGRDSGGRSPIPICWWMAGRAVRVVRPYGTQLKLGCPNFHLISSYSLPSISNRLQTFQAITRKNPRG